MICGKTPGGEAGRRGCGQNGKVLGAVLGSLGVRLSGLYLLSH